eukprot:Clim_evm12s60 gene=Clim_evmTU12s60
MSTKDKNGRWVVPNPYKPSRQGSEKGSQSAMDRSVSKDSISSGDNVTVTTTALGNNSRAVPTRKLSQTESALADPPVLPKRNSNSRSTGPAGPDGEHRGHVRQPEAPGPSPAAAAGAGAGPGSSEQNMSPRHLTSNQFLARIKGFRGALGSKKPSPDPVNVPAEAEAEAGEEVVLTPQELRYKMRKEREHQREREQREREQREREQQQQQLQQHHHQQKQQAQLVPQNGGTRASTQSSLGGATRTSTSSTGSLHQRRSGSQFTVNLPPKSSISSSSPRGSVTSSPRQSNAAKDQIAVTTTAGAPEKSSIYEINPLTKEKQQVIAKVRRTQSSGSAGFPDETATAAAKGSGGILSQPMRLGSLTAATGPRLSHAPAGPEGRPQKSSALPHSQDGNGDEASMRPSHGGHGHMPAAPDGGSRNKTMGAEDSFAPPGPNDDSTPLPMMSAEEAAAFASSAVVSRQLSTDPTVRVAAERQQQEIYEDIRAAAHRAAEKAGVEWGEPLEMDPGVDNGHRFHKMALKHEMMCDHCEDYIWGLNDQAYVCRSCGRLAHKKCCMLIVSCEDASVSVSDGSGSEGGSVDASANGSVSTTTSTQVVPATTTTTALPRATVAPTVSLRLPSSQQSHQQLPTTASMQQVPPMPQRTRLNRLGVAGGQRAEDQARKVKDGIQDGKLYDRYFKDEGKVLGQGQFGTVKVCLHKDTNETYAVKCIHKGGFRDMPRVLEDVKREIKIMRKLDHQNIIRFKSAFEDKDTMKIVMEYVSGGNLDEELRERRQKDNFLSEEDVAIVFGQLCIGVAYLHENNICHRDLKPANILIARDRNAPVKEWCVKIADFGLARATESNEMQTMCGTPAFLAPEIVYKMFMGVEPTYAPLAGARDRSRERRENEATAEDGDDDSGFNSRQQAKRRGYSLAVDVWSVGAMMYWAVVGSLPVKHGEFRPWKELELEYGPGGPQEPVSSGRRSSEEAGNGNTNSSDSPNGSLGDQEHPYKPFIAQNQLAANGPRNSLGTLSSRSGRHGTWRARPEPEGWRPNFDKGQGKTLSTELKELLTWMMRVRPSQRLTMMEVLGHPWFESDALKSVVSDQTSDYVQFKSIIKYQSPHHRISKTPESIYGNLSDTTTTAPSSRGTDSYRGTVASLQQYQQQGSDYINYQLVKPANEETVTENTYDQTEQVQNNSNDYANFVPPRRNHHHAQRRYNPSEQRQSEQQQKEQVYYNFVPPHVQSQQRASPSRGTDYHFVVPSRDGVLVDGKRQTPSTSAVPPFQPPPRPPPVPQRQYMAPSPTMAPPQPPPQTQAQSTPPFHPVAAPLPTTRFDAAVTLFQDMFAPRSQALGAQKMHHMPVSQQSSGGMSSSPTPPHRQSGQSVQSVTSVHSAMSVTKAHRNSPMFGNYDIGSGDLESRVGSGVSGTSTIVPDYSNIPQPPPRGAGSVGGGGSLSGSTPPLPPRMAREAPPPLPPRNDSSSGRKRR